MVLARERRSGTKVLWVQSRVESINCSKVRPTEVMCTKGYREVRLGEYYLTPVNASETQRARLCATGATVLAAIVQLADDLQQRLVSFRASRATVDDQFRSVNSW